MEKLTAHQLLNQITYNRNQLRNLLADIEFEDQPVDSNTVPLLENLLSQSAWVVDYLSSFSSQHRLSLPDELQIIYDEVEDKLKEFGKI